MEKEGGIRVSISLRDCVGAWDTYDKAGNNSLDSQLVGQVRVFDATGPAYVVIDMQHTERFRLGRVDT